MHDKVRNEMRLLNQSVLTADQKAGIIADFFVVDIFVYIKSVGYDDM